MLFYNFNNFYFLLPFIYSFFLVWIFFFKINKTQKLKSFKKDVYFKIFININFFILINFFFLFFFLRGENMIFWWNHLLLQNFNLYLIFILFFINFMLLFIVNTVSFNKINYSNDYFFALLNLTILLPMIFLSNNIFSFIFILELNTSIIFYKLVVSKLWYPSNDKDKKLNKIQSKSYVNLIFYQFWITFFSTIMIFFFISMWTFYLVQPIDR